MFILALEIETLPKMAQQKNSNESEVEAADLEWMILHNLQNLSLDKPSLGTLSNVDKEVIGTDFVKRPTKDGNIMHKKQKQRKRICICLLKECQCSSKLPTETDNSSYKCGRIAISPKRVLTHGNR